MVDEGAVVKEPEISEGVDDDDGGNEVSGILLSNFDIFVFAEVVTIKIDARTLKEQVVIAAELFVVGGGQFEVLGLHFPDVATQVVGHCIFEVVVVGEVLLRVFLHELPH